MPVSRSFSRQSSSVDDANARTTSLAKVVKGRYAEKHVPKGVRDIISAESGANDGLGQVPSVLSFFPLRRRASDCMLVNRYPFLFLAIYLMERPGSGSINASLQHWVVTTWIYQILLACVIGALIGWIARKTLKEAHRRQLIDHESFLAYGVGLTFLTLGIVGVLGSDDVLACFIGRSPPLDTLRLTIELTNQRLGTQLATRSLGRITTASRLKTRRSRMVSFSLLPLRPRSEDSDAAFSLITCAVIDNLLNTSVFIYLGSLMPCASGVRVECETIAKTNP